MASQKPLEKKQTQIDIFMIKLLPIAGKINAEASRASECCLTIFCRIIPRTFATKYPALLDASAEPISL